MVLQVDQGLGAGRIVIRVAIRFDDPSALSFGEVEQGILAALEDTETQATFAVIPFSNTPSGRVALDARNGAHLLAAQQRDLIEVALHGHSHLHRSPNRPPSEFCGIAAERQLSMVSEAAAHLRALFGAGSIRGFVPPWNSYDGTTLPALECNGFDYISAGERHVASYSGPLAVLPRTCQFTALEAAIVEVRRYSAVSPNIVIVAVLHHDDFRESSDSGTIDLSGFSRRLAWLKQQSDVQVTTLRDLAFVNPTGALFHPSKRWMRATYLPWRLRQRLPRRCLVDAQLWRLLLR